MAGILWKEACHICHVKGENRPNSREWRGPEARDCGQDNGKKDSFYPGALGWISGTAL